MASVFKSCLPYVLACVLLISGCSSAGTGEVKKSVVRQTAANGMEITLLPILDARDFNSPGLSRDVRTSGATISIPAEDIAKPGARLLIQRGPFSKIITYRGHLPESGTIKWSDFPLHDLKTDLAMGLEIKKLSLQKTGENPFLIPRSLVNAAALPAFALGNLISGGHFDLGGWIFPASRIQYTMEVGLNILSLKGGGLIFSKNYMVNLMDPSVSDRQLQEGFFWSRADGQKSGIEAADGMIDKIFTIISSDPELAYLPWFVRTAWLGRVLTNPRVSPNIKYRLLKTVSPELYPEGKNEVIKVQSKLIDQVTRDILKITAKLNQKRMKSILNPDEENLFNLCLKLLGRLGTKSAAAQLYRFRLNSSELSVHEKKIIIRLLSQNLEAFNNDEAINEEEKALVTQLGSDDPEQKLEAAALLLELKGEAAVTEYKIDESILLKIISPDHTWAIPMIKKALTANPRHPDIVRLAGIFRLKEALPGLLELFAMALEQTENGAHKNENAGEKKAGASNGKAAEPIKKIPDPQVIIMALECFLDEPSVASSFIKAIRKKLATKEIRPLEAGFLAEIIKAMGRSRQTRSKELIFSAWMKNWPNLEETHLVRRASLEALAMLGNADTWQKILEISWGRAGRPIKNQTFLRESIDFFGQIQYTEAVPFLVGITNNPAVSELLLEACFQALSKITDDRAEKKLKIISKGPIRYLSKAAIRALENQVRERAMWEGLKGEL